MQGLHFGVLTAVETMVHDRENMVDIYYRTEIHKNAIHVPRPLCNVRPPYPPPNVYESLWLSQWG